MRFNFDKKRFDENCSKKYLNYYKMSAIIGAISIIYVIFIIALDSDSKVLALLGMVGFLAIFNLILVVPISYSSYSKFKYITQNAKLFIENDEIHYHQKYTIPTGNHQLKSSKQYIIKKVDSYNITASNIEISGEILYTKDGLDNKPRLVSKIVIPRAYSNEEEFIKYLK